MALMGKFSICHAGASCRPISAGELDGKVPTAGTSQADPGILKVESTCKPNKDKVG